MQVHLPKFSPQLLHSPDFVALWHCSCIHLGRSGQLFQMCLGTCSFNFLLFDLDSGRLFFFLKSISSFFRTGFPTFGFAGSSSSSFLLGNCLLGNPGFLCWDLGLASFSISLTLSSTMDLKCLIVPLCSFIQVVLGGYALFHIPLCCSSPA